MNNEFLSQLFKAESTFSVKYIYLEFKRMFIIFKKYDFKTEVETFSYKVLTQQNFLILSYA